MPRISVDWTRGDEEELNRSIRQALKYLSPQKVANYLQVLLAKVELQVGIRDRRRWMR